MKQVFDPVREEWCNVDASSDADAVRYHLRDLDPRHFSDNFSVRVRDEPDDKPRTIRVRVVPMHFEVCQ